MQTIRVLKEHYLNELHIYCRLIDLHVSRVTAKKIAIILTYKITMGG